MKLKTAVKMLLLFFVTASLAHMIVNRNVAQETGEASVETETSPAVQYGAQTTYVAYYFHGNQRCATCKKIEAYTREALDVELDATVDGMQFEVRAINVDEAENEHFVTDFELSTRNVVLANYVDGEQVAWKSLDKVWDLVGDKDSFMAYMQDEAKAFTGKGS